MTLIDYESPEGRTLGKSLPSYLGMCQKAVYHQIFSPIGGRMRSIEVNDTRSLLFAAADGIHNIFSGVGISSIIYPAEHNATYLTNRFALEMLSGDWTMLDRQYYDALNAFQAARKGGDRITKVPNKRDSYLEDLTRLAVSERSAFFADIYEKLNPKIEDERGNVRQISTAEEFLSALLNKVSADFWSNKELSGAGTKQNIVPETLGNPESLVGDVKDLERAMDRDLARLDEQLRNKPRDILINTLSFADGLGEGQWAEHHVQSYIVKNGPHVVQVRVFLYTLQQMIEKRLETLDPSESRAKLYRLANGFEDEPDKNRTSRGTPGVLEKAQASLKGGIMKSIKSVAGRGGDDFIEDYVTYYNNSLKNLRKMADESIEVGMLRELRKEVDALEEIVTEIFTEIESLIGELETTCADSEMTYDSLATLDGNYWIYGSSRAKAALWEEMSRRVAGAGDESGVNKSLTDAIYKRYRAEKSTNDDEPPISIRDLFYKTVVDGYARERVCEENGSVYEMSVVQAVKREAALGDEDWRTKLKDIVRIVGAQSTPLLGIKDTQRNGQRIMFWSVNTKLQEQINDPELFQEMFTLNQGEAPVVLDEFSPYELTCMNTLVNLDLNQLSKLSTQDVVMGIPGNKGEYYLEYEKMVNGLVADATAEKKSGQFTPHIHRDWHIPGLLPEINPDDGDVLTSKISKGLVIARALGVMSVQEEYGNFFIEYNSKTKRKTGGLTNPVCKGSDWFIASKEFEKKPSLADDAIAFWNETLAMKGDERRRPVDNVAETLAYKSLANPQLLVDLMEISTTRIDTDLRDEKTSQAISAWADMVSDMVESYRGDLGLVGRRQEAERLVEDTRHEAIEMLSKYAGKETMRSIELAVSRGVEAYYKRIEQA